MIIKPNPLLAGRGPGNNGKGEHGERLYSPTRPPSKSNTIRADLIGDDRCHALGFTVCAVTPVLALCRRLLAAGYAGATPLEAWRGETCCLRIRSIGEAAALEINGAGTGFRPVHGPGTALPIRFNGNSQGEDRTMLPLTSPNPELDRQIRRTPAGMMFWAGTCPDPKATCGGCKYFGYVAVRNEAGNAVDERKYPARCELYWNHTKQHGKPFSPATTACKYFVAKRE